MDSVVVEEPIETQEETDQFADIETEAPQPEEQPQEVELPNKFKGKSMEDIVSSYENLEKELGRKGQEIGELRKLTDGILQQQLTTSHSGTEVQEEETDFFDDPDRAVNKAIESHPKFREFEEHQKVQAASATTQQLQNEHPDYLEVVGDPKFQEWVQANKVTKRNQALKAGKGVSRTSSESTAGKKIYRRADLIRLRTQQPERYEALQDEILRAYADGRVK